MNEWMKILVLGKTFRCTRNTFRAYLIKLETVSDKHLPLLKYDTFINIFVSRTNCKVIKTSMEEVVFLAPPKREFFP